MVLKKVSNEFFDNKVNIKFKNINIGLSNYINGMLEVKNQSLSFVEKENLFIDFFRACYKSNFSETLVDCYLKMLNEEEFKRLLDGLEEEYKAILIDSREDVGDSIYFEIDNEKILDLITILNTRNLFFCTLYLTNKKATIWGNYDLKFPIFFNDINTLKYYSKLAEQYGLVIQNINNI